MLKELVTMVLCLSMGVGLGGCGTPKENPKVKPANKKSIGI